MFIESGGFSIRQRWYVLDSVPPLAQQRLGFHHRLQVHIQIKGGGVLEGQVDPIHCLAGSVWLGVPDWIKDALKFVLIDVLYRHSANLGQNVSLQRGKPPTGLAVTF